MGEGRFSRDVYVEVRNNATAGGTRNATHEAEHRYKSGEGLNPLVQPKGLPHMGPVRDSRGRFNQEGDLYRLTIGVAMPVELLLDTTGSMGGEVEKAFQVLPETYELLTAGGMHAPLGRYDVQMANASFGDVQDIQHGKPVLCRSQFEMAEKIAQQLAMLVPTKDGGGNGKEDPQYGLFAAAFLTRPRIIQYQGMKYYHFTVTDEVAARHVENSLIKELFGANVLDEAKEKNGFDLSFRDLPDTREIIRQLSKRAHAFLLLRAESYGGVKDFWKEMYGQEHLVCLPENTTEFLPHIQACLIGLTEGVLDLSACEDMLRRRGVQRDMARSIVLAVAHIPIGEQTRAPAFKKLPQAGDLFKNKTDLWPVKEEWEVSHLKKPEKGKPSSDGWL
jgi:hypothetical protein